MLLLNKIKFDSDNRYDIYEKRISHYYNDCHIKKFQTKSLTDYIYKNLIQCDLTGVFYNTSISTNDVINYIHNIYIRYYTFYIKNHINDGIDFIITKNIINNFITNNSKLQIDTEWIYSKTSLNIQLDQFIINLFKSIYSLPVYIMFSNKTIINDIFIYLAKLLDFIINKEINTIVLKIALGHFN